MNLRSAVRFFLIPLLTLAFAPVSYGDTYLYANTNPNTNASIVGSYPQFTMYSAATNGIDSSVIPNLSTYATIVSAPETITFDWQFRLVTGVRGSWLSAGYLLNGEFNQLNNFIDFNSPVVSGTKSINLQQGDIFAFYLNSASTQVPPVVGQFDINVTSEVAATPEPASLILLGTGLAGIAGVVRRRISS